MFKKSQFYITQRFYISLAHVNQHPNFTYKILGYLKDSDTWMYPLCEQAYNNVIIVIIHGFHDFNKQSLSPHTLVGEADPVSRIHLQKQHMASRHTPTKTMEKIHAPAMSKKPHVLGELVAELSVGVFVSERTVRLAGFVSCAKIIYNLKL